MIATQRYANVADDLENFRASHREAVETVLRIQEAIADLVFAEPCPSRNDGDERCVLCKGHAGPHMNM
jgi:hypothetical protein